MLRTILWAIAGALASFLAAIALISLLLGGEICGSSPNGTTCSSMLGLVPIAAAFVGAALFGWFSRVEQPVQLGQMPRFGRMAASGRRDRTGEPEGRA